MVRNWKRDLMWLVAILAAAGSVAWMVHTQEPPSEAQQKTAKRANAAIAGAQQLQRSMHNPKSFELVQAYMVGDDEALCIVYRGTNAFNAVVTNQRVIRRGTHSDELAEWKRSCAGKAGEDLSFIRHML